MKITSGLVVLTAATTIAACGGTAAGSAPRTGAQVPVAVTSPAAASRAAASPVSADCLAQVEAWNVNTLTSMDSQLKAEFNQLVKDTYMDPSSVPAEGAPILATAEHFGPQEPPSCASASLRRDWAAFVASLKAMALYLKVNGAGAQAKDPNAINAGQAVNAEANFTNGPSAGLIKDLAAYGIKPQ